MKKLYTTAAAMLFAAFAFAQNTANWTWGHVNTAAPITINPIVVKQAVGASANKVLWGNIINKKFLSDQQYGDYRFSEFDTTGNLLQSAVATGKLAVLSQQADVSGNWYVLAKYEDSVQFAGGLLLQKAPGGSDYCMFRLHAGTLSCDWIRSIGTDFQTTTGCFTVANNQIYIPIDSNNITRISNINLSSGMETPLWTQSGQNMVTSIQVDSKGNIYLVGSCAFDGMNFNGHQVTLSALFQYPQYIVRYKANGAYDWSRFMQDGTCFVREFSLADDNTIYYTGPLNDTLTLGSLHLAQPPAFGSFLVAKMDSAGNFSWARQLSDTASGEVQFSGARQAGVGPNGSIIIYTNTRGYVHWGNGISSVTTPTWKYSGSVVAYGSNGDALWAKDIKAAYVTPQQMAISGGNIWVTGNTFDSTQMTLGTINVTLPSGPFAYYPYVARLRASGVISEVADVTGNSVLEIMPNPANTYFSVRGQDHILSMTIFDNIGKRILQKELLPGERIDVASLPAGIYFVEIAGRNERMVKKLLVR